MENRNIQKLNELSDLMEPISPQKPFGRFVSLPNRQMFKVFARILFLLVVTAELTACVTFDSTKCARLHRLYFPDTKYLGSQQSEPLSQMFQYTSTFTPIMAEFPYSVEGFCVTFLVHAEVEKHPPSARSGSKCESFVFYSLREVCIACNWCTITVHCD